MATNANGKVLLIAALFTLTAVLVIAFWPMLAALIRLACYGI